MFSCYQEPVTHLTRLVQLFEYLGQFVEVRAVKVQFAELCVCLEPKTVIFCIFKSLQSSFIEVLQQLHLQ